jgi:hypothetical protein
VSEFVSLNQAAEKCGSHLRQLRLDDKKIVGANTSSMLGILNEAAEFARGSK